MERQRFCIGLIRLKAERGARATTVLGELHRTAPVSSIEKTPTVPRASTIEFL